MRISEVQDRGPESCFCYQGGPSAGPDRENIGRMYGGNPGLYRTVTDMPPHEKDRPLNGPLGREALRLLKSVHQHFVQKALFPIRVQVPHTPPATRHLQPDFFPCLLGTGEEDANDVRVELLSRFANNLLARCLERLGLAIGAV